MWWHVDEFELSSRPEANPELDVKEMEDELLVYHPETGELHNLNGTAAFIWSLCDGTWSLGDLAREIHREATGQDLDRVEDDVLSAAREMADKGLLRS